MHVHVNTISLGWGELMRRLAVVVLNNQVTGPSACIMRCISLGLTHASRYIYIRCVKHPFPGHFASVPTTCLFHKYILGMGLG